VNNAIIHGDCLEVMSEFPNNMVTSIVTDPPYGLSFMGKEWDRDIPGIPFWETALRVTKPGGMLLAFGGTRTYHRLACAIEDAGWEIRDCLSWLYGSGFPKSHNVEKAKGGKEWSGYGTALKPAWEPIILAMKPLDGTFAANALAHGVAGINVDGCRLDAKPRKTGTKATGDRSTGTGDTLTGSSLSRQAEYDQQDKGRWPANVVLDEEAGALLDEQSGTLKSGKAPKTGFVRNADKERNTYGKFEGQRVEPSVLHGDSGGASRFFYCAKTNKKDRTMGGRVENGHPTVKPTDLMRWLVRLVKMPTETLILDPFCGSGSTGVACVLEGIEFIGCEQDEANYITALERLAIVEEELAGE
jgi:site-specific DNA-methyltransferase (adenine-specific)